MPGLRVLITGAGGHPVPGLIRALRERGYRVFAADMDRFAAGLYLADEGFIIPRGDSAEFAPRLAEICRRHSVDVFVPLVDEELVPATGLHDEALTVLLPRRPFVELCLDKFRLMRSLAKAGLPAPRTFLADEAHDLVFPFIVKPRAGRGSRGVALVKSDAELVTYMAGNRLALTDLIFQEFVSGTEYTVSVVTWRDCGDILIGPKEIIQKRGATRMAVTRRQPAIEELCRKIQERFIADGPFNVQLVLGEDGVPYPFEINPRISASATLSAAAGLDEVHTLIQLSRGLGDDSSRSDWLEGVVLLRSTRDEFFSEAEFKKKLVHEEANFS